MKFTIIHESPGRLRVRLGMDAFSKEEGYSISSYFKSHFDVTNITTCPTNGSILIYHNYPNSSEILAGLDQMNKSNLPVASASELQVMAETDRKYGNQLMRKVIVRYAMKAFLPPISMRLITWIRSLSYFGAGLNSLVKGRLDVAVLDASAIGASLFQKEYKTASSIMFLLSVSDALEEYTRTRAKISLTQSLKMNIDAVWKVCGDQEELVPISKLQIGDTISVRMGSMIPVDGTVVYGECTINEASMTGESLPAPKHLGSSVYGGTVIEEGAIHVKVRNLPDNTRINKIVDFIENSDKFKSDLQSHAEHLADRIVPFSFLTSVGVYLLTGNMKKALSVLMVDFSCAIKISTPISVISAIKEATHHKIMVKGGRYLEILKQADTIVFDKTGTLTSASPKVCKVVPFNRYSRDNVLKIAACIEEHFPHSVARAIVHQAEIENIDHREEHVEVEYIVAHGISTYLKGKRTIIGSAHFVFEDMKVPLSPTIQEELDQLQESYSCVYLAIGDRLAGCICIEDPPRPEARSVIEQLRQQGIQEVIMLTGDNERAAKSIADQLNIDHFESEVLPEEKAQILSKLKAEGKTIIMVGDGINDSPALSIADVSIAMRDASDIAREVADITLLASDLNHLIPLRNLSKNLLRRINHNYFFILSFNSSLLALGLTGVITPMTSALLHNLSTIGISLNSTRPLLEKNLSREK